MIHIIDELHTWREKNFKCPVCKEYLQNSQVRLLCKCGHLYCTLCADSLCREDSSVVCSVCKVYQSEEEIVPGDNVFSTTKQYFNKLVQVLREHFNSTGDDVAMNALITKICMKAGQSNKKTPSSTDEKENERYVRGWKKRKLVQEKKRGISSDNEPLVETTGTEVATSNCITTKNGDESPSSSDSSIFTDNSVKGRNIQRSYNFIMSNKKNYKRRNICKNISDIQNNENVEESDVEVEIIDDSESILQRSSSTGRVTVDRRSSTRLQKLKSDTPAESRRDKQSSQIDSDSIHVHKMLNSSHTKCCNTKKMSVCNVGDSVLNDISNVLDTVCENQLSPYKRELNRNLDKKKVNNESHKLNENIDQLEVISSPTGEERENYTPNRVHRKIARQLFAQTDNEVDSLGTEKPNRRLSDSSPYIKYELKKKTLSLSRGQNFNKTTEVNENKNKISNQTEDEREITKELSNTECQDNNVNKILKESESDAADSVNGTLEKTRDHVQVCNQSFDATGVLKDLQLTVKSQTSKCSKTDNYQEMENSSSVQTFTSNLSRTTKEQCNIQDEIMEHNEGIETNGSEKEMPDFDGTLASHIVHEQRTDLSSTAKLNGNIVRKDETENDYIQHAVMVSQNLQDEINNYNTMEEDSAKKKDESADEDDVVEATPSDIIENKYVKGLSPDSIPKRKTRFETHFNKSFNLETSLIEIDEELLSISEFTERFNGIFSGRKSSVTMDTTHLIMKTSENNRVHQTFKYLQAIVLHKPVVSFEWIQQSLKYGQPLPEEEFLVHGENGENAVELSLLNAEESLFQNFSILVLDPELSGLRSCRIEDLLITGGAYVVSEDIFRKVPRSLFKIVLTDEEITGNMCREHCAKYSAITLPVSWVFDSIAEYKLAPWQKYVPRSIRMIILQEYHVIVGELYVSSDEEDD